MKNLLYLSLLAATLFSCRDKDTNEDMPAVNEDQIQETAYMDYGATFKNNDVKTSDAMATVYKNLKAGDSVQVVFKGEMKEVCVNMGCWAQIPVGEEQVRVKFKDYGFFIPRNGAGKQAIFSGKAFKEVTTVADLKHYAEDGGKTPAEIAAITEDQVTLSFLADGVKVEKFDNPDVASKKSE